MSDISKDQDGSEAPVELDQLDEVSGGLNVGLPQEIKNVLGPKTGPVPGPVK